MIKARLAVTSDAKALAEMNWSFNRVRMDPAAIAARLRKRSEIVAVAVEKDVPVGFACARAYLSICYPKQHGEITELYVERRARRKGIGSSLIGFAETHFAAMAVTHVRILTGIGNRPAQRLYQSLGYACRKDHPELLYEKDIGASSPRRRAAGRRRRETA